MSPLPLKKDIEKVSYELLKGSKSLHVLPTPVNQIVAYSEHAIRNDIDLSKVRENYITSKMDVLKRALAKVRGALDRRQKHIYIDMSQLPARQNFVKLHEVGHGVLPWQKAVYDLLDDDDQSLENTHEEFEAEANFFASVTLFQHERFADELNKLPLEIGSPMALAKMFGASVHASLRRYVEYSKNRCALLVLEKVSAVGEKPVCFIKDVFQSTRFSEEFGDALIPTELGYTWEFVKDFYHRRRMKKDGMINIPTLNGDVQCRYHFFYNNFNAFVFLFPLGETKSSRTTIVVEGLND